MKTNAKTIFHCVCVVAFAPLLTGCLCSSAVLEKSDTRTVDTFNPSTVYHQTTNHSNFALEGTRKNYSSQAKTSHAFLIIPQDLLTKAQLQTNEDLSIDEIRKLQAEKSQFYPTRQLELKRKLPCGYEKVADLPKNEIQIEIKEHHPDAYLFTFLPITAAFDVVSFPFQYCYMMTHPQFW